MATTESFHAQLAIRQRVPLLSGFFTPSPTHKHGPDTAKRYEDLEKGTEFIISQGQAADLTPNPNASSQPPRHQRVNSTSRLNIFNKVFTSPSPPSPPVETTSVTILLLPQSGTRPLLLTLRTIDIRLEGHKDNHLSHIPDMRSFWGDGEAWHARIQKYARLSLSKVEDPEDSENLRLAGTYMLLYTPEGNGLPLNQRWGKGVSGDACVVKLGRDGNVWGKGGAAAYEDVEREFLDSGLYRKMLMGMFDSPEKESSKGHNKNDLGKETS